MSKIYKLCTIGILLGITITGYSKSLQMKWSSIKGAAALPGKIIETPNGYRQYTSIKILAIAKGNYQGIKGVLATPIQFNKFKKVEFTIKQNFYTQGNADCIFSLGIKNTQGKVKIVHRKFKCGQGKWIQVSFPLTGKEWNFENDTKESWEIVYIKIYPYAALNSINKFIELTTPVFTK